MKISEILREAQTYLWPGYEQGVPCTPTPTPTPNIYSCNAIRHVEGPPNGDIKRVFRCLKEMGLDVNSESAFDSVPYTERQGARFMWLEFAALMAEEQGQ